MGVREARRVSFGARVAWPEFGPAERGRRVGDEHRRRGADGACTRRRASMAWSVCAMSRERRERLETWG
eukprot:210930-Pleurochrysis_carterae.AAC.1